MKTSKTAIVLLALGASAWMVTAQDGNGPSPRGERPERREGPGGPGGPGRFGERGEPGGPGRDGQRPPPPPLVAALDANHDGVIDKKEIAKASKALKKLDKNGDGKLTMDELRPPGPKAASAGVDLKADAIPLIGAAPMIGAARKVVARVVLTAHADPVAKAIGCPLLRVVPETIGNCLPRAKTEPCRLHSAVAAKVGDIEQTSPATV